MNVKVEVDGRLRNVVEVCEERGLNYYTVMDRRYAGWADADLFKPIRRYTKPVPKERR